MTTQTPEVAARLVIIHDLATGTTIDLQSAKVMPYKLNPEEWAAFEHAKQYGYVILPTTRMNLRNVWSAYTSALQLPNIRIRPKPRQHNTWVVHMDNIGIAFFAQLDDHATLRDQYIAVQHALVDHANADKKRGFSIEYMQTTVDVGGQQDAEWLATEFSRLAQATMTYARMMEREPDTPAYIAARHTLIAAALIIADANRFRFPSENLYGSVPIHMADLAALCQAVDALLAAR